jgi:hypothetical protein
LPTSDDAPATGTHAPNRDCVRRPSGFDPPTTSARGGQLETEAAEYKSAVTCHALVGHRETVFAKPDPCEEEAPEQAF